MPVDAVLSYMKKWAGAAKIDPVDQEALVSELATFEAELKRLSAAIIVQRIPQSFYNHMAVAIATALATCQYAMSEQFVLLSEHIWSIVQKCKPRFKSFSKVENTIELDGLVSPDPLYRL